MWETERSRRLGANEVRQHRASELWVDASEERVSNLPPDTRVVVHGATTELDPAVFGPPPSLDTGRVVLSGRLTARVEFDDGTLVVGIPWAVIEAHER
ncbi:MAG: hypothetical protein LC777_17300 [Actinobacteria bacterium]|nr:hypothetical protein [Actinomycetota bacterium]